MYHAHLSDAAYWKSLSSDTAAITSHWMLTKNDVICCILKEMVENVKYVNKILAGKVIYGRFRRQLLCFQKA